MNELKIKNKNFLLLLEYNFVIRVLWIQGAAGPDTGLYPGLCYTTETGYRRYQGAEDQSGCRDRWERREGLQTTSNLSNPS